MSRIGFLLATSLACCLQGCASVKVSLPALSDREVAAPRQEHEALRDATRALRESLPDAASDREGGLRLLVFGGRSDAETEAARRYLDGLPQRDRLGTVLRDASRVLAAADAVAEAGMVGTRSPASETDLTLLESAITDLQQGRRLLTTALRLLREDGAPLSKAEIRDLGDAFVASARRIGSAADLAAASTRHAPAVLADAPGRSVDTY